MAALPDNSNLPVTNRPETIYGVVVSFICVSTIAVTLRLFVRARERLWGWDDSFVLLAALASVAGSTLVSLMPQHGLGKHFYTLDDYTIKEYFKYVWASNITYCFSATFIKLAILSQYLRLFKDRAGLARKFTLGLIVFVILWGLAFDLLAIFSCKPIALNWNFSLPGRCIAWGSKKSDEFFATWMAHSISNLFLDSLILALPVPFIRNLRMSGKTRTGLVALFVLGGIAVSFSLARVVALSIRRLGTVPVFDPSFATPTVYLFSVLELNMAMIAASIPTFWPYVVSLAANKILIVNEIEIRTERIEDSDYALTEHNGKRYPSVDESNEEQMASSRTSLGRCDAKHKSKASDDMMTKEMGLDPGNRPSHESLHDLNLTHRTSERSFRSENRLVESPDMTHARYQDKFMQDWAVPDFDKGASSSEGMFTASAERAEIPYDHIRALEK